MAKILVVDDHDSVRTLIRTLLERAGHRVIEACDGAEGLRRLYADSPDLVVLDLTMPRLGGFEALDRIRALTAVPVLVCSGSQGDERIRSLRRGADDYLTKPFDREELLARVEALLRRAGDVPSEMDVIGDGWMRVDRRAHEVIVDDRRLDVTPLEFRLLGAFLENPGLALSHDQLLELAWENSRGSREQVKAAVLALRRKLAREADVTDDVIETVRGVGYLWRTPQHAGRAT